MLKIWKMFNRRDQHDVPLSTNNHDQWAAVPDRIADHHALGRDHSRPGCWRGRTTITQWSCSGNNGDKHHFKRPCCFLVQFWKVLAKLLIKHCWILDIYFFGIHMFLMIWMSYFLSGFIVLLYLWFILLDYSAAIQELFSFLGIGTKQ